MAGAPAIDGSPVIVRDTPAGSGALDIEEDDIDGSDALPPPVEWAHAATIKVVASAAAPTMAGVPMDRGCFIGEWGSEDLLNGFQHLLHFVDFRRLIRFYVGRELEVRLIVAGVAVAHQFAHHGDGTEVMA